jgi:hypothetical protein
MAASPDGQEISSAADRPGSDSVPLARNAPRQTAARSWRAPVVSLFGAPHRTATRIEQTGLTRERLAAFDDADGEVAAGASAGRLDAVQLGRTRRSP